MISVRDNCLTMIGWWENLCTKTLPDCRVSRSKGVREIETTQIWFKTSTNKLNLFIKCDILAFVFVSNCTCMHKDITCTRQLCALRVLDNCMYSVLEITFIRQLHALDNYRYKTTVGIRQLHV